MNEKPIHYGQLLGLADHLAVLFAYGPLFLSGGSSSGRVSRVSEFCVYV